MDVSLTPQLAALVRQKVETGLYHSPSEVVHEALRLLDERDRHLQWLRAELKIGLDQEARGEVVAWTPDFMERLKREADERSRLGLPVKDAVKP
ncbi:MAG: type II toxin-antitoxin system ParD family antitoxin [Thermomicrobiales bacterium]